jgi:hypothetical protein
MNSKFEVLFLEDARKFLGGLDIKTRTKILYNIDKSRVLNDPKLFKSLMEKSGSFGPNLADFNTDFLLFGIRPIRWILW